MTFSLVAANAHAYTHDSLSGITQRAAFLSLVPLSTIASITDLVSGIFGVIASLSTLGRNKHLLRETNTHIKSFGNIISAPYLNLLKTINPNAPFTNPKHQPTGYLAPCFISPPSKKATEFRSSDNFFHRHISSRLSYALTSIVAIISRALDGVIGTIAAPISILTLGKFQCINNAAFHGLKAPALLTDLFYLSAIFINPFIFTP